MLRFLVLLALVVCCFGCSTEDSQAIGETASLQQHLVRVHLPLAGSAQELDRYGEVEARLEEAILKAGVGSLDCHEVGAGEYTIWLYGADGGKLGDAVREALRVENLPKGSSLFIRRGSVGAAGAKEEKIAL